MDLCLLILSNETVQNYRDSPYTFLAEYFETFAVGEGYIAYISMVPYHPDMISPVSDFLHRELSENFLMVYENVESEPTTWGEKSTVRFPKDQIISIYTELKRDMTRALAEHMEEWYRRW